MIRRMLRQGDFSRRLPPQSSVPVAVLLCGLIFALGVAVSRGGEATSRSDRSAWPTPFPAGQRLASTGPSGFTPAQIRHAYGIDRLDADGAGQVIAVVTAYDNPTITGDLQTFNQRFDLPPMHGPTAEGSCTVAAGPHPCLERVYVSGKPAYQEEWAIEAALNVQWAHAIAPGADILLVEASEASFDELLHASDVAVARGAPVIALSWGSAEFPEEQFLDQHFRHPAVVFVAPAGDTGSGVLYPAASPEVVAVGGTTLTLDPRGEIASEAAWIGSGGGESAYEHQPAYQARADVSAPHGRRVVPDVAYAADPRIGFPVYNSRSTYGRNGWFRQGGTSAGVPQWAALFALANQSRGGRFLSSTDRETSPVYQIAAPSRLDHAFRDIVEGVNGDCQRCRAGLGFDWVTGFGSPRADGLIPALRALGRE